MSRAKRTRDVTRRCHYRLVRLLHGFLRSSIAFDSANSAPGFRALNVDRCSRYPVARVITSRVSDGTSSEGNKDGPGGNTTAAPCHPYSGGIEKWPFASVITVVLLSSIGVTVAPGIGVLLCASNTAPEAPGPCKRLCGIGRMHEEVVRMKIISSA